MITNESTISRESLGFKEAVLSAFRFLIDEYGFRTVKAESTFVRFESPLVFVNVYHGRVSFELGVELGQIGETSIYPLYDFLDLLGKREEEGFKSFAVRTPELVKEFVPKIAQLMHKYGNGFLKGDPQLYANLLDASWARANRREREVRLKTAREIAEKAWQQKDFRKLAEVFNPVKEDLTPAESKKLEYAQKRLGQG